MSEALLPCVEVGPEGGAEAAVVWLHGLGADGHDFEPVVPLLGLGDRPVRFVFPHAPRIPVTINMGFVMPAWYDIRSAELEGAVDEDGIAASVARVGALLARERERGVAPERTVLAGFSQGGAIALRRGLIHPERLAGILALSTYLPPPHPGPDDRAPANASTPILMMHGSLDPMVPIARGRAALDALRGWDYPVEWKEYPMGHEVVPPQLQEIGRWLRARLGLADADA